MLKTLRACALAALVLLPASAALAGELPCAAEGAPCVSPVHGARQLVVVTTEGWDSVRGTLRRYERRGPTGRWQRVGAEVPVVVGRNGLGWGVGRYPRPSGGLDPVKREGDGRAPAGVFDLSGAFGYAPAAEVPWIRLPYTHSTAPVKCVDDVESAHYNRVVDETKVAKDWSSREDMLRTDPLYRLGVIVDHNWAAQTTPGDGSCIFLHVWKGPGQGTAGCTAMPEPAIRKVLGWLHPAREPVLVQLPAAEYAGLRRAWGLP